MGKAAAIFIAIGAALIACAAWLYFAPVTSSGSSWSGVTGGAAVGMMLLSALLGLVGAASALIGSILALLTWLKP